MTYLSSWHTKKGWIIPGGYAIRCSSSRSPNWYNHDQTREGDWTDRDPDRKRISFVITGNYECLLSNNWRYLSNAILQSGLINLGSAVETIKLTKNSGTVPPPHPLLLAVVCRMTRRVLIRLFVRNECPHQTACNGSSNDAVANALFRNEKNSRGCEWVVASVSGWLTDRSIEAQDMLAMAFKI